VIDLTSSLQSILQDAHFRTSLASLEGSTVVCFEDDVLMGFACTYATPRVLLAQWHSDELSLLRRYAPNFRTAGEKAWNVYVAFLTPALADKAETREVQWIEENLERTRKLASCGVATRADLIRALLPLLPLQHQPLIEPPDLTARLRVRIRSIAPDVEEAVLNSEVSAEDVVRLLTEAK